MMIQMIKRLWPMAFLFPLWVCHTSAWALTPACETETTQTESLGKPAVSPEWSWTEGAGQQAAQEQVAQLLPVSFPKCKCGEADSFVVAGGLKDKFFPPQDPTTLDADLQALFPYAVGYDVLVPDRLFADSLHFSLPAGCTITGAKLKVHARALHPLTSNDTIRFFQGTQQVGAQALGLTWPGVQLLSFDLGALGLLSSLQDGDLDVVISDDASINYLELELTRCCKRNGSICGSKFDDANANGIWDSGESGLSSWTITLTDAQGNLQTTQTDVSGAYCFRQLPSGKYTVGEVQQTGWTQTAPSSGTYQVKLGACPPRNHVGGLDFGNHFECDGADEVSGFVFQDNNANGNWNGSEPGLAGWTVTATSDDGSVFTTLTDATGAYTFTNLPGGNYTFTVTLPGGYLQTTPSPNTAWMVVDPCDDALDAPVFGVIRTGENSVVCGYKWLDANANSVWDTGESALPGWTIQLKNTSGTVLASMNTTNSGYYCLQVPPGGPYRVQEVQQPGYFQTYPVTVDHPVSFSQPTYLPGLHFGNNKGCAQPTRVKFTENSNADPSEALSDAAGNVSTVDYGENALDDYFLDTLRYELPLGCAVQDANLILDFTLTGGNGGSDQLILYQDNLPVYAEVWNPYPSSPMTLDLNALTPPFWYSTSIVSSLQDGALEVLIQDDTRVNSLTLELELCCYKQATPTGRR